MSQMDGITKAIDGEEFRVLMLDPLIANDLLVDIGKTLGPALGALLASILKAKDSKAAFSQLLDGVRGLPGMEMDDDTQEAVSDLIGDGLERALVGLIDRIEKGKLRDVISIMESVTSVRKGNDWPQLGTLSTVLFRGRLKLMYKWLAFAIRVQYRDFF